MVDSGISIHATPRKNFLTNYVPGDFGTLKMDNRGLVKIISNRDVCLQINNSTFLVLRNVMYILNIYLNLIFISMFNNEEYCNIFYNGQWKSIKGAIVLTWGNNVLTLYMLKVRISSSIINVMEDELTIQLWHKRLAYMSEKGLVILVKKNLLSEMKSVSLKKCTHYLAGKQNSVSFKSCPP